MKRIFLFLVTNIAVMLLLSVIFAVLSKVFGLGNIFDEHGINYVSLLIFSAIIGFGGAFISLLMSKPMAKWMVRAKTITGREGAQEAWLVQTVEALARNASVKTPEVAIYDGAPNAFATGAFRNSALVAVSTGLMQNLSQAEVRAVLGHEMAHVANGDMVTMTLLQGVLNTFVIAISFVIGFFVDRVLLKNKRGFGIGFFLVRILAQIVLGIFAMMILMAYSRRREYRADAGSAEYLGSPSDMVSALRRLGGMKPGVLPEAMKSFGINDKKDFVKLFSSHPPIEERIAHLEKMRVH